MLVAALFRHDGVPQDVRNLALHRAPVEIAEPHAFGREDGHVAVGQEKHVPRVAEDGRHVRRHKVLVVADPDHHRRSRARGHDLIGIGPRNHRQREHAGDLLDGRAHGFFQIAVEVFLHQVRDHFRVRLGLENMALGLEELLQGQVVLDDPVVHHHHVALAIAVRVRVLFGGPPVRGPARVPDAVRPVHRVHADGVLEVAQLAFGAADGELAVVAVNGQPRRIVAPIFEASQSFEDDRNGLLGSDVTHNPAHSSIIGVRSVEDLDPILLDDGIGENFLCDGFDVFPRLFAGDAAGDGDVEELALPHVRNARVPEPIQRRTDGLTLWVEDRRLQGNEHASFHVGTPIIARPPPNLRPRSEPYPPLAPRSNLR